MAAKTRTLRIAPRHIMTGDLTEERTRDGIVWVVVTGIDPSPDHRGWLVTTVRFGTYYLANQRRITVRRSGPTGLGE